jgi:hypothetical protein
MKPLKKDRLSEGVKSSTKKMATQQTTLPKAIKKSRDRLAMKEKKNIPKQSKIGLPLLTGSILSGIGGILWGIARLLQIVRSSFPEPALFAAWTFVVCVAITFVLISIPLWIGLFKIIEKTWDWFRQ